MYSTGLETGSRRMYLIHVDGSIDMEYIVNWYGIQYITNKFIHLINLELYTKRCYGLL